jgi:hypothetical protein
MKITVVLGVKGLSILALIQKCKNYILLLTGNVRFQIAALKTPVDNLKTSVANLEENLNTGNDKSKTDRVNAASKEVLRWLNIVANQVEILANQPDLTEDESLAIIHEAGMEVRASAKRNAQVFEVRHGAESGTAEMSAKGGVDGHEWQSTTDLVNFLNRVSHKSTTRAKTIVTGFTPGEKVAFFHRAITPSEDTTWEGPVFLTII